MNNKLPIQFKIIIGMHSLVSVLSLWTLGFYVVNNVVSDNGMDVAPLKVFYALVLLSGIVMIILLMFTKRIAFITECIYAVAMIFSGIGGNYLQVVIGIIILILIINKTTLKYVGFMKPKQKNIVHKSNIRKKQKIK